MTKDCKLWDASYINTQITPTVSRKGMEKLRELFETIADDINNGIAPGHWQRVEDSIDLCTAFIDTMKGGKK
jgi:hypothetical protein